jgi:hypothetical protein
VAHFEADGAALRRLQPDNQDVVGQRRKGGALVVDSLQPEARRADCGLQVELAGVLCRPVERAGGKISSAGSACCIVASASVSTTPPSVAGACTCGHFTK